MQNLFRNIQYLISSGMLKDSTLAQKENLLTFNLADLTEITTITGYTLEQLCLENLAVARKIYTNIQLLILDVDGVLTDGGMYYSENGDQLKKFNTKDGMAILHLMKKGVLVGIISSGFKNDIIKSRADTLKIPLVYVGRESKINVLNEWCKVHDISLENVAMIGDDVNDLSIIERVGLSACPADAVRKIKQNVDIILAHNGGQGCVREFIENYLLEEDIAY